MPPKKFRKSGFYSPTGEVRLTDESWMNLVRDFRRKFRRAAGAPESMKKEADKHGCRKMYGIGHSRAIFDKPPQSSA